LHLTLDPFGARHGREPPSAPQLKPNWPRLMALALNLIIWIVLAALLVIRVAQH
jgi:hypothetical protein